MSDWQSQSNFQSFSSFKKYRIFETLNHSMCAHSSTKTNQSKNWRFIFFFFICHVYDFTCQVFHVSHAVVFSKNQSEKGNKFLKSRILLGVKWYGKLYYFGTAGYAFPYLMEATNMTKPIFIFSPKRWYLKKKKLKYI